MGKTNTEADALSHIHWSNSISAESVQAILNAAMQGVSPLAEICVHSAQTYLSCIEVGNDPRTMSVKYCTKAQRADPDLNEVIKLYQERCLNTINLANYESKDLKLLLRQRPKLRLRSGVLYLKSDPIQEDCNDMWLILPKEYQGTALQGCHDDVGHPGLKHMLDLLRDWFYWPTMPNDAEGHIHSCERCL